MTTRKSVAVHGALLELEEVVRRKERRPPLAQTSSCAAPCLGLRRIQYRAELLNPNCADLSEYRRIQQRTAQISFGA